MLSSKYRIPKKDILGIIKKGKRTEGQFFDLKSWFDDSVIHPKFAIVVSKKVSKSAVVRNRIKRLFKTSIYQLLKENKFRKGNHVFIIRNFDPQMKMIDVKNSLNLII